MCGLEQVLHSLYLGFPICEMGIITHLPCRVVRRIERVSLRKTQRTDTANSAVVWEGALGLAMAMTGLLLCVEEQG